MNIKTLVYIWVVKAVHRWIYVHFTWSELSHGFILSFKLQWLWSLYPVILLKIMILRRKKTLYIY